MQQHIQALIQELSPLTPLERRQRLSALRIHAPQAIIEEVNRRLPTG